MGFKLKLGPNCTLASLTKSLEDSKKTVGIIGWPRIKAYDLNGWKVRGQYGEFWTEITSKEKYGRKLHHVSHEFEIW